MANVSRDQQGTVFDATFLRGAQASHMHDYHKKSSLSGKFTLGGPLALADESIAGLDSRSAADRERAMPPFHLAFFVYPAATAWYQGMFMLYAAADCYSPAKIPARKMLQIIERIPIGVGHKKLTQILQGGKDFREALTAGAFKLDDPIMLQMVLA
ncbi:hypothetical protein M422DRAFT_270082 [Sphaerobolus stellatus SS14]|uniref:Unplaced genomic scaffold SPHSTscaffold_227, whole genome shotgun sequence n=1 Tax=Sphaerobolus stellatus (strain SS14) TaxID=990650 RepID=A0A0C9UTS2_SPHS4|nr:hypothetical protein M422DRAFT_270082 [Sphaerobolus stellatus SS14]